MNHNKANKKIRKLIHLVLSRKKLSLVFWAIASLIFASTAFSTYYLHWFGDALDSTISQNMPALTSALNLSAQSAVLAATAPAIAVARAEDELNHKYQKLEENLAAIMSTIKNLPIKEIIILDQLKKEADSMQQVLEQLKRNTHQRLSLSRQHAAMLLKIQDVQRDLAEVLTPIEYGVTSLTNLFGKQTIRKINRHLKKIYNNENETIPRTDLISTFDYIDTEISELTEVAIKDMGYSLSLKASGNKLINIMSILAKVESEKQIMQLLHQFNLASSQFSLATNVFKKSTLAKRNPVLSNNVHAINGLFHNLAMGNNSLFNIRTNELKTNTTAQIRLKETREAATKIGNTSKKLAELVNTKIRALQQNISWQRKKGILIVSFVSGGSLILVGFIAFSTIMALKRQEEALHLSHEQLEQRVKDRTKELQKSYQQLAHAGRLTSLGEMATGIAHEINQPLTIISLASHTLKKYFLKQKETSFENDAITSIEKQIQRTTTIINNMRSFARAKTDQLHPINISESINTAISFFKEQFRLHQIKLIVTIDEGIPKVLANPQKFEQIVVNLLSNARYAVDVKAEHAKGNYQKMIHIRLSFSLHKNNLVFEVEDNGTGMSDDNLDHCMEPFYTSKEVGDGTGLGLSIVHNIVAEFKGKIEIENNCGKGCLFRVLLPGCDDNDSIT